MNTLPRAITAQFFTDPQSYTALRQQWSRLVNSDRKHELSATHHLIYLASCGKDWRKGFTPITNPRKLANGGYYTWGLFHALAVLHYSRTDVHLLAPFEGTVTPEMLQDIRRLLPTANAYDYKPERFANSKFPFEAYLDNKV
jgi:hypothetical protein